MPPENSKLEGTAAHPGQSAERSSDDLLVARIAEGDAHAFDLIVNRHLPRLLSLARRMLGNDAEAEDISQEALLRLWQNASKFDPDRAKLSTWLHRITANLCIDKLRGRRETDLEEVAEQHEEADQDHSMTEKQLAQRMDLALQNLPERQRLALVLFHYEEMSLKDAAVIMEISVDAIESLLRRARRTLKDQLEKEWRQFLPESEA